MLPSGEGSASLRLVPLEATSLAPGSTEQLVSVALCAPFRHHAQAEGFSSPGLAFHQAVERPIPEGVLGAPSPAAAMHGGR